MIKWMEKYLQKSKSIETLAKEDATTNLFGGGMLALVGTMMTGDAVGELADGARISEVLHIIPGIIIGGIGIGAIKRSRTNKKIQEQIAIAKIMCECLTAKQDKHEIARSLHKDLLRS